MFAASSGKVAKASQTKVAEARATFTQAVCCKGKVVPMLSGLRAVWKPFQQMKWTVSCGILCWHAQQLRGELCCAEKCCCEEGCRWKVSGVLLADATCKLHFEHTIELIVSECNNMRMQGVDACVYSQEDLIWHLGSKMHKADARSQCLSSP